MRGDRWQAQLVSVRLAVWPPHSSQVLCFPRCKRTRQRRLGMGTILGYVTVFESTDAGTGDPHQTTWQFHVDPGNAVKKAVITRNARLADTMRFAVEQDSRVQVTYVDGTDVMVQARLEFNYLCEELRMQLCPGLGEPVEPEPKTVCVTRRFSPCRNEELPKATQRHSARLTRTKKRARVA